MANARSRKRKYPVEAVEVAQALPVISLPPATNTFEYCQLVLKRFKNALKNKNELQVALEKHEALLFDRFKRREIAEHMLKKLSKVGARFQEARAAYCRDEQLLAANAVIHIHHEALSALHPLQQKINELDLELEDVNRQNLQLEFYNRELTFRIQSIIDTLAVVNLLTAKQLSDFELQIVLTLSASLESQNLQRGAEFATRRQLTDITLAMQEEEHAVANKIEELNNLIEDDELYRKACVQTKQKNAGLSTTVQENFRYAIESLAASINKAREKNAQLKKQNIDLKANLNTRISLMMMKRMSAVLMEEMTQYPLRFFPAPPVTPIAPNQAYLLSMPPTSGSSHSANVARLG